MTGKMTPKQLRDKAKELIEQAAMEETKRQQLIGKMVTDFVDIGFDGFDLELFKTQAKKIWRNGKIKRKQKSRTAKTIVNPDPKEQKSAA